MSKVLILSARPYEMKDEETGKMNTGVSIWFVGTYTDPKGEVFGSQPMKASVSDSLTKPLTSAPLPAVCEVEFEVKPGAASKASITVQALTVLKSISIAALISSLVPKTV